MSKDYLISEHFLSIQGEGKYTGVPTAWVRFFKCNLQCNGFGQSDPTNPETYILPYKEFDASSINKMEDLPVWKYGCDSSYSWSAKFKHLQQKLTASQICDLVEQDMMNEFNPKGKFFHPKSKTLTHMCFTGGEPLLKNSQEGIIDILDEFKSRMNYPTEITIETNGTQPLSEEMYKRFAWDNIFEEANIFFSVSPKLFTVSGEKNEKAIRPEIVRTYTSVGTGQLKFVMGSNPEQWEELDEVIEQFREAGVYWPVHIMPVGATEEGQLGEYGSHADAGEVANMAIARGYNVSARVHVYLFGNTIGV